MSKIVGIDLGTTNSCVAVMDGGEAVVIPNSEGSRTTPSMVAFTESGERLVGQIAKRQAVTNSENTVFSVKRFIGRSFDSDEVKQDMTRATYKVVAAENGEAWIQIRGKAYSPQEISAMILMKMKETAEDYLGEEVTEAVITVPAYFNDAQRQATKDAGKIAGLNVQRIINEPTAAALAYGLDKKENVRVAVYDLGGGTFDISVLELGDGVFEVKATNGDTHLGGDDFDLEIINYLAKKFSADNAGADLRRDKMALQRLKEAAEKAKHELSSSTETDVNLPFIMADATGPKHMNYTLTRQELEKLVEPLIQRSLGPCKTALADAGVNVRQIDEVLLVGGQTRMPRVITVVKDFFGREPNKKVNPDEVVAIGAAIQGGVLKGEVKDVLLLDVNPLSLGVETAGGVFTAIIPKNTTIPAKKAMVFSTAMDNQPIVDVHVLQGERPMAEDNKTLARFQLVGIPPAPRGVPQIEVGFDIDANGIVQVAAKDLGTGKKQQIRIIASSGLSPTEIDRMIKEAEQFGNEDRAKKQIADLRNMADGLIYTTEKSLEEYSSMLTADDIRDIKEDLESLKKVYESNDVDKLKAAIQRLEGSSHRIAEAMYREATEDK
ncbi:molecular chaperone DnaK [Myxococcota bacterium]|nr:molecular chaperone DnaK [Myxococcota bacterium]